MDEIRLGSAGWFGSQLGSFMYLCSASLTRWLCYEGDELWAEALGAVGLSVSLILQQVDVD